MDEDKRSYVTNKDLQLELKSLRTEASAAEERGLQAVDLLRRDVKVWAAGVLVANQVMSNISIPSFATTAAAIGGGLFVLGKIGMFAAGFLRG